jgi:Synergist-CTERM protein sorting domain-containing protein
LWIKGAGKVVVNRDQFFSYFNTEAGTTFQGDAYTLVGQSQQRPQITTWLAGSDSIVDGQLTGYLDLVVESLWRNGNDLTNYTATNNPENGVDRQVLLLNFPNEDLAYIRRAQVGLYLNNTENDVKDTSAGVKGTTLVADGILSIAGAKSIGSGTVTVGTTPSGASINGFTTKQGATFVAQKTFKLPNKTVVNGSATQLWFSALAAESNEEFSFADVTLDGREVRINPQFAVRSTPDFAASSGSFYNVGTGNMRRTLAGTVKFGAPVSTDATYSFAGVSTNATQVYVDRGVLHLDSYPTRTAAQAASNQNGFAEVYVYPAATLSLGEGVQDFRNYLSVSVADDSRIRVIVLPENVASTWQEAVDKSHPAAFTAMEIDYTALGIDRDDKANKDHRILIEVDLTKVGSLKAGSFIPLVRADKRADHWDALHYQRESSTGQPDDLPKVTVSFPKNKDIVKDTDVKVYLNQDTWDIGIEVLNDLTPPAGAETPVDATLATAAPSNPSTVEPGQEVELFYTIGANYNPLNLSVVGLPEGWTAEPVVDNPDGYNFVIKGVVPEGPVSFYLTGTRTTDGVETKSNPFTINAGGTEPEPEPEPEPVPTPAKKSSSGGCDAGFAGLALLFATPLFLRKKD